jgi:hypothetical protein
LFVHVWLIKKKDNLLETGQTVATAKVKPAKRYGKFLENDDSLLVAGMTWCEQGTSATKLHKNYCQS